MGATSRCPMCDSATLYRRANGITSGDKYIFVHGLSMLTPRTNKMTLVCTTCGHYREFVADREILDKIARKWEPV